jgi:hypothetical protein
MQPDIPSGEGFNFYIVTKTKRVKAAARMTGELLTDT